MGMIISVLGAHKEGIDGGLPPGFKKVRSKNKKWSGVSVPKELFDWLNEYMAKHKEYSLSKSGVLRMALSKFMDDEKYESMKMKKLMEEAYSD